MNIVGPLLLLGGAIFVAAKRCELLGLCGETTPDSGSTEEISAEEIPENMTAEEATDGVGKLTGGKSGCCTCEARGEGGKIHCHTGDGNWFNPAAGSGGSNDFNMSLSLIECNKTCGGSSSSKSSSSGSTTGAKAGVSSGASIPKKPRLSASGSVGSGAGAGGTRKSSSSSKTTTKRPPGGAVVNAGASFYGYYKPVYRSYFADPYNPRPFRLFHRIAN